jgi:GNAT superfamily N-acetyltransferase
MSDLVVRNVRETDLDDLVRKLGHEQLYYRHLYNDRFDRQRNGLGQLLMACRDGDVVGVAYLWLEPAEEPEIREHLPGVPLLMHLEVPDAERKQGFGTLLMDEAEKWLRERGTAELALAVEVGNTEARKLYVHLGYREWDHETVECREYQVDKNAEPKFETCHVLVKDLVNPDNVGGVREAQRDDDLLWVELIAPAQVDDLSRLQMLAPCDPVGVPGIEVADAQCGFDRQATRARRA